MTDMQSRDTMLDEVRLLHLLAHCADLERNADFLECNADFLERQAEAFKAEAEQNRKIAAQLTSGIERYGEILG